MGIIKNHQRVIVSNVDRTRDLYYFDVTWFTEPDVPNGNEIDSMYWESSLSSLLFHHNPELEPYLMEVLNPVITNDQRQKRVDILNQKIQAVVGIESQYFKDYELTSELKFNEHQYETIKALKLKIWDNKLIILHPYSMLNSNSLFFQIVRDLLIEKHRHYEIIRESITKKEFEVNLVNTALQNEYVELYEFQGEMLFYKIDVDGDLAFFLYKKGELIMFFFKSLTYIE